MKNFKRNKNGGFEMGTLIFWLAILFLIVAGFVYKNIVPVVKNAPLDGTPDIDAPQQKKNWWGNNI